VPTSTPTTAAPAWGEDGWVRDAGEWVVGTPLTILLILVLSLIGRTLAHRLINRVVRTMATGGHERPGAERRSAAAPGMSNLQLMNERRRQRAETMGSILRSIVSVFVFGLAFVLVLGELGINLAPIVASAGIAGVALGFGAQALVKDFLSGVFMILEDQYGVGDVIDTGFGTGTVEEVGLRVTRIRDVNGVVWYVRNGEILRIGNRSQGWSLAIVDLAVPYDQDLDVVRGLISDVGDGMLEDPDFSTRLLEPPVLAGVESVAGDAVTIRVTARTAPQESLAVARELRERLKDHFDAAGISVPVVPRYPAAPPHTGAGPS
jgi:small-conductance mechanosensitive channel